MPIKKAGLGLLNPVTSDKGEYLSSQRVSTELIRAVTEGGSFSNADHLLAGESRDRQKNLDDANKKKLRGLVRYLKGANRRLILRAKNICAWLSSHSTMVLGTVLSATQFWYFYAHAKIFTP